MTELERQLARQLSPMRAPEALWDRIHEQRRPLRVSRTLGSGALVAALALVILTTALAAGLSTAPGRPQAEVDVTVAQAASCATGSPSILGARLLRWKGQPLKPEPRFTYLQADCALCHAEPGHATSVAF
jgi:hypothetical protein